MKLNLLSKTLTLVLTALLMTLGAGTLMAQTQTADKRTTGTEFIVPCGVTRVTIKIIGGGGAGGYVQNGSTGSGGGGGGAYSEIKDLVVAPNQKFTYNVGAGGIATTEGVANGSPSNVKSGGVTILEANGGAGASGQTEGSGGSGGFVITGGSYVYESYMMNNGGKGAVGIKANQTKTAGGGGAAGNSLGNGGNAIGYEGGKTATIPNPPATYGGNGGNGGDVGTIGFNYGGGGGGTTGNAIGANGAGGVVVFEYTLPPTAVISFPATPPVACKNKPFSTTLTTSNVSSISTSGLPTGLTATLSGNIITISGTTNVAAGNYNYTITANSNCATTTFTGTITVAETAVITNDLTNRSYCAGSTIPTLQVTASGTGLTYQWYSATSATSTSGAQAISGATGASYVPTSTAELSYYYVVVTGNSACGSPIVSKIAAVTRNTPVAIVSGPAASATFCVGSVATALSVNATGSGLTYQWYSNTTNSTAGGTAIGTAKAATFTPPPTTTAGTYFYYVIVTGSCGLPVTSSVSTITVNPATVIKTQPTALGSYCANSTATLNVEATGTGTLYYQWYSNATNSNSNGTAIDTAKSATFTPSTTIEGTQYYYVTVTGCNTVTSSVVAVRVGAQNTWNGTSWSQTADNANMQGYNAVIDADYNTTKGNIVACNCTVNSGKTLTISANTHMTVDDTVVNKGSLIVESDGNLVQVSESAVNVGNITVYRDSPMKKNNYTYWGSPVSGQQLGAFSPGTSSSRFYQYMQSTNQFATVTPLTSVFVPGKGYAIMAPGTYSLSSTTVFRGAFVGVPNNGNQIKFTLERGAALPSKGFNMIANPYPSNIDFDKLYEKNQGSIFQTAYFWTNVDPNRPGSVGGNTSYSGNGYAIYNGTGGVASVQPAGSVDAGVAPTNIIKVGQGFIVKAKDDANGKTLTFDNTMRNTSGDSHFFSKQVSTAKDRFWLKLTTPARNINTILIGYVKYATNGFEYDFDSPLMVVGSDSFYSILDDKKLGIQGRSYPLEKSDIVSLGTKHFEKGDYTISLGNHEGVFNGAQSIFLLDLQTNITTNLSEGDYTYSSEAGEFANRFQIVYEARGSLAVDSNVKNGIEVYRDSQEFVVRSGAKKIESYEVIDMVGRIIFFSKPNANAKEVRIDAANWVSGTYIIKAKLTDGSTHTTKVIK